MARNKDPAVLFYTDDFLAGTMTMTDAQVGKYIRLLCLQHQQGHLPESTMLYICKKIDPVIWSKFTTDEDGLFYNQRMDEEIETRRKHTDKQRENVSKRWAKTDTKPIPNAYQIDTKSIPLGNGNGNGNKRNIPPLIDDVKDYCKERNNGVDPNVWYDFYSSKNWMIGKNKMTDWKAAVRTWEAKRNQQGAQSSGNVFLDMLEERRAK